jgi:selenide,water dikinase
VIWDSELEYEEQMILCDAQTSGGLLISVPAEKSAALIESLEGSGALAASRIGRITEEEICKIRVSA